VKVERRDRGGDAEDAELSENDIGQRVLGCALAVHRVLGPGLLESAYEACLAHELSKAGLVFDRQLTLPVTYDGMVVDVGYRLDLLVERLVVVEIKATDAIATVHRAQLLSYLKLGGFRLWYLLNFNVTLMKDGIVRIANGV
jgi:GxxExxY protein